MLAAAWISACVLIDRWVAAGTQPASIGRSAAHGHSASAARREASLGAGAVCYCGSRFCLRRAARCGCCGPDSAAHLKACHCISKAILSLRPRALLIAGTVIYCNSGHQQRRTTCQGRGFRAHGRQDKAAEWPSARGRKGHAHASKCTSGLPKGLAQPPSAHGTEARLRSSCRRSVV
jgi:hypothetical protein